MQGDLALNGRERTVLCSIGGEQREARDRVDLRWQQHERPSSTSYRRSEGSSVARAIDASSAPA
jgi:hypothetical protein